MTEILETPNIEAALNLLLVDAGIEAHSSLPKEPTYPLIVTERLGGVPPVPQALDAARVQLMAWGNNKTDALATVKSARTEIYRAEGQTLEIPGEEGECFVTGVEDESVNLWLPDPRTGRARYMTTLRVYSKSVVGGSS